MSLNWKEIDLVLSELELAGAKIERIVQPSYDSLVIGLYKGGKATELLISIAQGACRLHSLRSSPPRPPRALRFQECLRARLPGSVIESAAQLGSERIVRFELVAPRTEGLSSRATVYKAIGDGARKDAARKDAERRSEEIGAFVRYRLYARLWSGAGNVLLVDEEGIVVDAIARRPKRGELSGEPCSIEKGLTDPKDPPRKEFAVRELPPAPGSSSGGGFNERVEAFYSSHVGELSRERLLESARERYGKKARSLEARVAELSAIAAEFRGSERMRELGDILMANQGLALEGRRLVCADFYRGGEVLIPVDPTRSIVENAQACYENCRKAKSGLAEVESELELAKAALDRSNRELVALEAEEDPFMIARALAKGGAARASGSSGGGSPGSGKGRSFPCLSLERSGWTILVGRSAKENDELLRHCVRGSDLWLHARDWPGSYVFIKAKKDKSVPLELLLDAGQLAIYYSKGRANGGGDLYYTYVKNLRRAKDAPKGTVLPSHEKNLFVKVDEARIRELRALMGDED